ncbi:hypothetical protein FRAAL0202 [Frankia alni ACN14a]|uniref:Uncharacterized protein n=1 Tax=Frankia alni (strain DSM 45986 / CECT 9034 / ACN14a) TaxID=326424 RepID=Q0RU64_FRAAA|nr:hypothetical protein FRAAL0202 [Frankia alni ACN14a]
MARYSAASDDELAVLRGSAAPDAPAVSDEPLEPHAATPTSTAAAARLRPILFLVRTAVLR